MAAPCEETGIWGLFRRSASQDHQGHLSPHHQEGTEAGEPLVSHSTPQHRNPAQSPGPLPMAGPVTLFAAFSVLASLQTPGLPCVIQ